MDERTTPDTGDRVGLGRVVEDHRDDAPSPDPEHPAAADPAVVEQASAESFPASDPPGFGSDAVTPRDPDRDAIELPAPGEVP